VQLQIWQAIVLGLVEGITEYLPISSTGHLILASALMGLDKPEVKQSIDAFNIVVQGGAILAVAGLYWPRIVQMLRGLIGKDRAGLRLAINLVVAFIPAAVLGKLLDDWIEAKLFYVGPVLAAVVLGGVYMIAVDRYSRARLAHRAEADAKGESGLEIESLTPARAFVIGFLQCVAMWPGTSRSMMTITGGMLVGLRPVAAAEFSFLLGLPTLGAATLYKLYKNLSHARNGGGQNLFEQLGTGAVLIGLVVATLSAAIAVKWLVGFLNKHGLTPFAWYRFGLAVVIFGLWQAGMLAIAPAGPVPASTPPVERAMLVPLPTETM
jgi:undecaprenyl-diphosphatase